MNLLLLDGLSDQAKNRLLTRHKKVLITIKDGEFTESSLQALAQTLEPHEIKTLLYGANWGRDGTFIIDGEVKPLSRPRREDFQNEIDYHKAVVKFSHEMSHEH